MQQKRQSQATLTPIARFAPKSFLEALVVRHDNSILITVLNHRQLAYVPAVSQGSEAVEPQILHTFDQLTMGIVETERDIFYLLTGNIYTTHDAYLYRLDLRDWVPGAPVHPELVLKFPEQARGVNGCCLVAPGVILVADCFASLIWRVDLNGTGGNPSARVWLEHASMGYFPGQLKPEQPGVNGVRFASRSHMLYYTATAKKLLMRVATDPDTAEPIGEPEIVVAGRMGDDFCIDEDASILYLTTHRQNTIDKVSLEPAKNSGFTESVVGDPFTFDFIGPSSCAWGRLPGEFGRVLFATTDGGTASPPPDGVARPATVVRVDLPPASA